MKQVTLEVTQKDDLVKYIMEHSDYSKNKIKSFFKYRKIILNNQIVAKLPTVVDINDVIKIDLEIKEELPFDIIYEDNEIIVIDKKAGLLTIGTMHEQEVTLYRMVREYALKNHFQVFVVHRLDRETSGIVMFAKSERMKRLYQDNWNELVTKRGYIAIVEGKIDKDGRIENFLYEENNTFVHSSKIGKKAITNYHVINSNKLYTLLDINIETGRKNQIRVHMSELGYPVVGDKKYGSKNDPIHRMALHAYCLEIRHPIKNETMIFKSGYPDIFSKIIKSK